MSNYNSLKTTIDANIKQNGNQEITGQILNSVLNQMVNTLGAGYQFAGVATTSTNPGTPDAKVFYIANGKGTYTNFGGLQVTEDDVVVLYWDSSWHKVSTGIASQVKLSELDGRIINVEGIEERKQYDSSNYYGLWYNSTNNTFVNFTTLGYDGILIPLIEGCSYTFSSPIVGATGIIILSDLPILGRGDMVVGSYLIGDEPLIALSNYKYAYVSVNTNTFVELYLTAYLDGLKPMQGKVNEIAVILSEINGFIDEHVKDTIKDAEITYDEYVNGLLNASDGSVSSYGSACVSDFIPIIGGKTYFITTQMFWSNGLYVFYDSNKAYISGVKDNIGGSIGTKLTNEKVVTPSNASYIKIASWGNTPTGHLYGSLLLSKAEVFHAYSGKKWAVVGDSLTEENIRTSKHYFDYVADATGISIANFGIGGTGYARSQPFYQRISSIPSDVDVITIFGSGNDSGAGLQLGNATDTELTSLCGYINKCIDEVQTRFPLVPFGIITPTPWIGFEPNERMSDNWFINYSAKIVEICQMRGVPCLDLYHCSNLHPSNATFRTLAYSKDNGGGVHPDENGHKIISPRFKAFIDGLLL